MLFALKIDLSINMKYDRLTYSIMRKQLRKDSNCIDVGCHKGEILEEILKFSPEGKHFGFEPIPNLYKYLLDKYSKKASILPYALSNRIGEETFNFVKNDPAYSGLKKRKYNRVDPEIEKIKVKVRTLDSLFDSEIKIDFIKIDVEGAELLVLKGARELLLKSRPLIVFECGLGASEYYGTKPNDVYDYFEALDFRISRLEDYMISNMYLSREAFIEVYKDQSDYYFIAYPDHQR